MAQDPGLQSATPQSLLDKLKRFELPLWPSSQSKSEANILDKSTIGIVEAGLDRVVTYANPAAMSMMGLSDYQGMRLHDLFADQESHKTLDGQLVERREGLIGNYRVNVRRKSDGVVIPVEVTGVPVRDAAGNVVGSQGLFRSLEREQLVNELHDRHRAAESCEQLLDSVGERINQAIPHDVMIVTRYSKNQRHANSFFVRGLDTESEVTRRWVPLNQQQLDWIGSPPAAKVIPDFPQAMKDPLWASMRNEPLVKSMLESGCQSILLRAVYRPKRLIGVISLVSKKPNAFTQEHLDLIEQLPLDATMVNALEYSEAERVKQRLQLMKALTECFSTDAAAKTLVEHLVQIFGWSHVALFRVEEAEGEIALLQQYSKDKGVQLDASYRQDIGKGVLGRVVREAAPLCIPDTAEEHSGWVSPPGWSGKGGSELCCPIILEGEKTPRWIINVEDRIPAAFSTDEFEELREIAAEVAAAMQRISEFYLLTQSFDHASDAIFVTDAALNIRKANQAAARLLGRKGEEAGDIKGDFARVFEGANLRGQLSAGVPSALGEFTLTFKGDSPAEEARSIPVHLSCQPLPERFGYVFVAKDLRQMRRSLELQALEQYAYEVAVEVSTPLSLALASLEGLAAKRGRAEADRLEHLRHQLARVKRAYNKLAMFNPDARPTPAQFIPLDLPTELEVIRRSLAPEAAALVHVEGAKDLPGINGDPFQISFTLETLLSFLLRSASQRAGARVEFEPRAGEVEVRLSGHLPGALSTGAGAEGSACQAELQIAQPLILAFVRNHGGAFERTDLADGRHQFVLRFPARAVS